MKPIPTLLVLILLLLTGIGGFIAGRAVSQPKIKAVHMTGEGGGTIQVIGKAKPIHLEWNITVEPEYVP